MASCRTLLYWLNSYILFLLFFAIFSLYAQGKPRLAVLPFTGGTGNEGDTVASVFSNQNALDAAFIVVPRTSSIERVMSEQKYQQLGITDTESIVAIAKALNAQYVLAGIVSSMGIVNLFDVKILDTMSDGLKLMKELAQQLTTGSSQQSAPEGFIRIEGGTFKMGSPSTEADRDDDDEIQHRVTISSFYMGQYEVTQAEYEAVMGSNPSDFTGANLPVENVSWYDAIRYCNKRSEQEKLTPAYTISGSTENPFVEWNKNANGYRLPTEAEWEYACRAGTMTPFYTGNNITTSQANYDGDYPYNNNAKGEYREKTMAVESFAPNAWGLYDMHGNVLEWCWDWYGDYSSVNQKDPAGDASGSGRVYRGGGWVSSAQFSRSAFRNSYSPSNRHSGLGFRLVLCP